MALPTINPTTTKAWKELTSHYESIKNKHLKELFKNNPERATELSIEWNDFYVDYSKNRIDNTTIELLLQLAEETKLSDAIASYFNGDIINETEGRAVLHTALRNFSDKEVNVSGHNIIRIHMPTALLLISK